MRTHDEITQATITMNEYQELAGKTASPITQEVVDRFYQCSSLISNHLLGLAANAQILDGLKKYIFYGNNKILVDMGLGDPAEYTKDARNYLPLTLGRTTFAHQVAVVELVHGLLGIFTEGMEILEAIEPVFCQRHDSLNALQRAVHLEDAIVNLAEEAGDVQWYIPRLIEAIRLLQSCCCSQKGAHHIATLGSVGVTNINKLATRYPDKFNEKDAAFRDLSKEAEVLENGVVEHFDTLEESFHKSYGNNT